MDALSPTRLVAKTLSPKQRAIGFEMQNGEEADFSGEGSVIEGNEVVLQKVVEPITFLDREEHVRKGELFDYDVHSRLPNVKIVVLADHLNLFISYNHNF